MCACLDSAPRRDGALPRRRAAWLLVLGLTAVAAVPAAAATAAAPSRLSYHLYGNANLSLDYLSNDNTAPGQARNAVALGSNQSYLGVFAVQPLTPRWLAVARLEGGVQGDTGHVFDTDLRDTYVGIAGPWGLFKAGHFSSPYKLATEWMDPFRDTLGDAQAVLGNVDGTVLFSEWYSNSLAWQSPEYRRWQIDADYVVNQGSDQLPQTTQTAKRSALSIDIHGHNDYMKGGIALERRNAVSNTGGAGTEDIQAIKLYVASWIPRDKRRTLVTGVFERADGVDVSGTGTAGRSALYFSATYHWRTLAFKAALGWLSSLNNVNQSGAVWYALGATHYISPRIEHYVVVTLMSNDANATYGLGQFQGTGLRGNGNVPGLPDKSVLAVSLGLRVMLGTAPP